MCPLLKYRDCLNKREEIIIKMNAILINWIMPLRFYPSMHHIVFGQFSLFCTGEFRSSFIFIFYSFYSNFFDHCELPWVRAALLKSQHASLINYYTVMVKWFHCCLLSIIIQLSQISLGAVKLNIEYIQSYHQSKTS